MPKKKGGKKGAKIIDGVATNEMTRDQLMSHVKRIQTELNREREERNFFMLEREKLYALWSITLEELEGAKTETQLADARMDDNERERQKEMLAYKQRLRFLLTQQSRNVAAVRLHNLKQIRALQNSASSVQGSMLDTIEGKNKEISKMQASVHSMMRQLQVNHAKEESKLRSDFSQELRRLEATFERLLFDREKKAEVEERAEVQRTREEKSEAISQLIKLHESQLQNMKGYFNEITANNFATITALQEEIARLQENEEELKLEIARGKAKNEELLQKLVREKEDFDQRVREDRKCAAEARKLLNKWDKRVKTGEKYCKTLEVSNEVLLHKAETARKERDALKAAFTKAIIDMQRKASMQKLVLEMRLKGMEGQGLGQRSEGEGSREDEEEEQENTLQEQEQAVGDAI